MPEEHREALRQIVKAEQMQFQLDHMCQTLWAILPSDKTTVEEVETQMRQMVENALAKFRADTKKDLRDWQGPPGWRPMF